MRTYTLLLLASLLLTIEASALAQPTPSGDLAKAFQRQAERASSGQTGTEAFQHDLEPLAARGEAVAQFYLATVTMGTDPTRSLALLSKAADAGCAGAAGALAIMLLPTRPAEAKPWLQRAAAAGDGGSMAVISGLLEKGTLGYEKNEVEAVAWAELALRQSFSKGASGALKTHIAAARSKMSPSQLAQLDARRKALFILHPTVANYPCGQSLP